MKTKQLALLIGLTSCSILSAQIVVDFTAAEGYETGFLGDGTAGTANVDNWNVGTPGSWTVDSTGTGSVSLAPLNFNRARYTGTGSALTTNNYIYSAVFTLNYTVGTSADNGTSNWLLGRYDIENLDDAGEFIAGGLRQGGGIGEFNLQIQSRFDATNAFTGGSVISATALGLSVDGSNNWLDADSDVLQVTLSTSHDGSGWDTTLTLSNLTQSTEVLSISQLDVTNDVNGSFLAGSQGFLLNSGRVDQISGTVSLDSLEVTAVPEPGTYALLVGLVAFGAIQYRRRRLQ